MSETISNYTVMPTETLAQQLADRCRSLERQLQETREALRAAEKRENCLILERIREGL